MVLGLLIGVFFCFTYPLIVDRGLKAIPAIKTSFRAGYVNFGGILCLILLNTIISGIAFLFCILPVLLVVPITIGSISVAYRRVFPEKTDVQEPPITT